jgi:hypothetical protein
MTDDLATKLNTAGAFDSPWLKEQLRNWNAVEEQKKADFMEHMYQCSGRHNPGHPMRGLYTGLWHDFCIREAGPHCRNQYFEMVEAVRLYEESKLQPVPVDTTSTVAIF